MMKVIKDEKLARMYDLYKNILSETQKDFMEDFIERDLTISEIGQNNMISRQAANDAIKKAILKFNKLEEKLNFYQIVTDLENKIKKLGGEV